MIDMNQVVSGLTLDIDSSVKKDKNSNESKKVTLRFHFEGVTLRDVFTKALSSARISWQNGPGRSQWDSWKNGQVVDVNFASPGQKVKTREDRINEYVNAGMPRNLAEKLVDNPELMQKLTLDEDEKAE